MKATVIVMPKKTVLDPQGSAVRDAIRHLDHRDLPAVKSVRVGKFMEIELDTAPGGAPLSEEALHAVCRDLLSNPVIEDYELRVES